MAQPITNNAIMEVTLRGLHQDQRVLSVLHYAALVPPAVFQDFNEAAPDVVDALLATGGIVDKYLDAVSVEYALEEIRLQLITPIRYSFKSFLQASSPGTVAGTALPPNEGATLTKRNDATGRRNRGSLHMPALPISFVGGGRITTAGETAYLALGDVMVLPITTTGGGGDVTWNPVIFNKAVPTTSPEFTSVTPQLTTRTNRRRTVGVGE